MPGRRQTLKKVTLKKGIIKRMLSYILTKYAKHFALVIFLILISSVVNVASSIFLQTLIDDYVTPLLGVTNPDFTPLLKLVLIMFGIYMVGVVSTFVYSRIMIIISQGTLKRLRNEMFCHMQTLPIDYFHKHEYGDIMSVYTNDIDALREMISQGLPQVISSIGTIAAVLFTMIKTSIHLTGLVLTIIFMMFLVTKEITKRGSQYFLKQQNSIGEINAFIEEIKCRLNSCNS